MAIITVRNIPSPTKEALRVKAAKAGVSLEQYVRNVLEKASNEEAYDTRGIMEIASSYFAPNTDDTHSIDELELPTRSSKRKAVEFKG